MRARSFAPTVLALLLAAALAPTVSAEFGPESPDGWPINVDGEEVRPPVDPVFLAAAAQPLNKAGPFTAYPYYPILTAEVQRLASDHPDLVKLTSAGKSELGLDIWLLEIADFGNPDMKPLEERERFYIDGGTHSNEYSGVYFVTEIAQFLLDEYATNETAKWIVENRHTFIIPMVNPDGSNAFGRLNAHAVNVNRNFPVLWGEIEEFPVVNEPGPEPASEKETRTVMSVLEKVQPDYAASIHCCGNLWLFPYGVEGFLAPDKAMLERTCDEVFASVREDCGETWSTIYPASGITSDTAYELTGAASWSFEMSGRGAVAAWGQPVIADDPRVQERESWDGIMHAFLNVEKYGAFPVLDALKGDGKELVAKVRNDGWGPLEAGRLTVGGVTVDLPALAPGETADVPVKGAFKAGNVDVGFEWQKRIMKAPWGARDVPLELVEKGNALVAAVLPGTQGAFDLTPASSQDLPQAKLPAPGLVLGVLALAGAAAVARRRA